MAEISAQLVKKLRDMTDAGFMECKKALVEADGDLDKAIDVLRTNGAAKAVKKADRATNEGTIATFISPCGKKAAMLELLCETDFVSSNATFKGFAEMLAEAAAKLNPSEVDAETFKESEIEGTKVADLITDKIATIGENMNLSRVVVDEITGTGAFESYVHMGGKIGILVKFAFNNDETAQAESFKTFAHDVAMQVAAANPITARREDVPQSIVDHEVEIYKAQAAQSGKPEAIQEKMAVGRLEKFFKQSVLTEQEFIKDPDTTISAYAQKVSKELGDTIEIVEFVRFNLGEGNSE